MNRIKGMGILAALLVMGFAVQLGTLRGDDQAGASTPDLSPGAAKVPAVDSAVQQTAPQNNFHGTVSVKFAGGTLGQLIEQVNKSGGAPFNVIATKDQLAAEIPSFEARNVYVELLADSVSTFLQPHHLELRPPHYSIQGGNVVFTVVVDTNRARESSMRNESILDLSAYLKEYSVEDIVAALRVAWEIDPAHNPKDLSIKFHPPTKLLFVSAALDNSYNPEYILGRIKLAQPQQNAPAAAAAPSMQTAPLSSGAVPAPSTQSIDLPK